MRLSAHDIRSLTFRKVLRGLDGEEVQAFLETVADQVAQRDEELAALRIRVSGLEQELAEFHSLETGLRDTLAVATAPAHENQELARREGELIIKQAELDGARITQQARERLAALRHELLILQDQRSSFVIRARALVKSQLELLEVLGELGPESSPALTAETPPAMPAAETGSPPPPPATPAPLSGAVEEPAQDTDPHGIAEPVPGAPPEPGLETVTEPEPGVVPDPGTPDEDDDDETWSRDDRR